jgi:hypothetical protein
VRVDDLSGILIALTKVVTAVSGLVVAVAAMVVFFAASGNPSPALCDSGGWSAGLWLTDAIGFSAAYLASVYLGHLGQGAIFVLLIFGAPIGAMFFFFILGRSFQSPLRGARPRAHFAQGRAPDEDRSGGFEQGGWLAPHFDEAGGAFMGDVFRRAGSFLLGRKTYEIFAGYWPQVTDEDNPVASALNRLPKYVASRSLQEPSGSTRA